MKPFAALVSLCVASAMLAGPAQAQDDKKSEPAGWPKDLLGGTFSVQLENDKIVNTDRHYTNGFRVGWVSDRNEGGPDWLRDTLEFLYPSPLKGARIGFSFGQTIFTPNDTTTRAPIPNDRPYAGWLFVGGSLHGESLAKPFDILDTAELTVGMVGPHAYGEQVQNNFHSLIGVDRANGWANQIKDEPALDLMLERRWRSEPVSFHGIDVDAIPYLGGSLGNVFTFGGGGLIVRLGQGLNVDYGPSHIQPSLSGPELMAEDRGLAWYLFAGIEGRGVLRNIFLDGNTFADSQNVNRKPFVGDFQLGLAVAYARARVSLALVQRTKEFDGQPQVDRFGALNLSWHF